MKSSFGNIHADAWEVSFDYPYVVYHVLDLEDSNLYLLDLSTNTTLIIDQANWGKVSGDYVVYVKEKKAHLYRISTEENTIIKETEKTSISIDIVSNKCLILVTEDKGQDAVTELYIYQIGTGELTKAGKYDDWIIDHDFDGRYLFWDEGDYYSDIKVMDTDTITTKTMATEQWIGSLVTGTFSAEDKTVVWASNFEIHMGEVIE